MKHLELMLLVLPVKVVQFTVHTKYGHIFKKYKTFSVLIYS